MRTKRITSWAAAVAVLIATMSFLSAFITAQAASLFTVQGAGGTSFETGTIAELTLAAGNTAYRAVNLDEKISFKFHIDSITTDWVAFGFGKTVITDLSTAGLFALNFTDGRLNVRGVYSDNWYDGDDYYNAKPTGDAWGTGWHTFVLESNGGLWTMMVDGMTVMDEVDNADLNNAMGGEGYLSIYTVNGGKVMIDVAGGRMFTTAGDITETGTVADMTLPTGGFAFRKINMDEKISFRFRIDSITSDWLAFGFGKTIISSLNTSGLYALNFADGRVNVRGVYSNNWMDGDDYYNAKPTGDVWGTGWHTFVLESEGGLWTMLVDGKTVMDKVDNTALNSVTGGEGYLSIYTATGGKVAIDIAGGMMFTTTGGITENGSIAEMDLPAGGYAFREIDMDKRFSFRFRIDEIPEIENSYIAFGFGKSIISDLNTAGLYSLNYVNGRVYSRGVYSANWMNGTDYYNTLPNGTAWGAGWHTFELESENDLWTILVDGKPIIKDLDDDSLKPIMGGAGYFSIYVPDGGKVSIDITPVDFTKGALFSTYASLTENGTIATFDLPAGGIAYRSIDLSKRISFSFRMDEITSDGFVAFGFSKGIMYSLDTGGIFPLCYADGTVYVRSTNSNSWIDGDDHYRNSPVGEWGNGWHIFELEPMDDTYVLKIDGITISNIWVGDDLSSFLGGEGFLTVYSSTGAKLALNTAEVKSEDVSGPDKSPADLWEYDPYGGGDGIENAPDTGVRFPLLTVVCIFVVSMAVVAMNTGSKKKVK